MDVGGAAQVGGFAGEGQGGSSQLGGGLSAGDMSKIPDLPIKENKEDDVAAVEPPQESTSPFHFLKNFVNNNLSQEEASSLINGIEQLEGFMSASQGDDYKEELFALLSQYSNSLSALPVGSVFNETA